MYTAQISPVTQNVVVDVNLAPRSANVDPQFCTLNSSGTTSTPGPNPAGVGATDNQEFTTDAAGKITFGVVSATQGVIDVTAFVENNGAAGGNGVPNTGEPSDSSVQTVTAGDATAVTTVDASPNSETDTTNTTVSFTAKATNSAGQGVSGQTIYFDVTSGPNAAAVAPTACTGTTDQTGTVTCSYAAGSGTGTDTIVVWIDNSTAAAAAPGVKDAGDSSDTITKTFQAPLAAGATVSLTCADNYSGNNGGGCQVPLGKTTETLTATVKNASGVVVPGAVVNFSFVSGNEAATPAEPADSLSPTSCSTNASGQCTTTLTNPVPGQNDSIVVRASVATGATTATDDVTVLYRNPVPKEARNIVLTPETATKTVGDVQAFTATVTDRFGNPVQNVQVTFGENGTGRFTTGGSTVAQFTNASGQATVEITSTQGETPGGNTITSTVTGYDTNANGVVDAGEGRGALTNDDECEQPANTSTYDTNGAPTAATTGNQPGATAGNCADTSTMNFVAASSPSPSPSSTGTVSPPAGAKPTLSTSTPDIQPNIAGKLHATGITANATYELRCYSRPSTTYFTARTATAGASDTTLDFSILPGTNTRCYVRPAGDEANASNSVVINVHTSLSLSAYRDGVRMYHFQGTNLPRRSGQLITLYRWARADNNGYCDPHVADNDYTATSTDPNCVAVRTAIAYTNDSNVWRIDRTFTGSGQFVFMAKSGQNLTNAAGVSNLRLTIIH
jgi:hypothetical protein